MKKLGHGADVEYMARLYKKTSDNICDFSSNINPRPVSNMEEIVQSAIKNLTGYPDIEYKKLRENISSYTGVGSEFIIPGNGATEIIYLLMKNIGKRLAIVHPTFSEYERSAVLSGLNTIDIIMDYRKDFELDIDYIESRCDEFDSIFICNPNNPDGSVRNITRLLDMAERRGKLLIIDETFIEFTGDEDRYSLKDRIEKSENLFIIRAVTKFFGIPGVRLGYGMTSNKKIIEGIYRYKEPWTINSFADAYSDYIFKDSDYISESKTYFLNERKYMIDELSKVEGIKAYRTDANFILIKLEKMRASDLRKILFERAEILIRDASNFKGLDESFIRIAIKSHEDNERFINAINSVMGE